MIAVEGDEGAQVEVGDAVGVGETEGALAQVVGGAGDAPAGGGVEAGVEAAHLPVRRKGRREGLDPVCPVAEKKLEAPKALARVERHHVPQDRLAADLDERLRQRLAGLAHARALAAAEDGHREHRGSLVVRPGSTGPL